MKISAKQIARSKPLHKTDGGGNLFLVGYRRRDGKTLWLKKPKLLEQKEKAVP